MNQMAPTQPQPLAPETRLTVTLPVAGWQVVMDMLDKGQRRHVNAIYNDMNAQLSLGAQEIQRTSREMATHPMEG